MKKYLLGVCALVLAIAVSSFESSNVRFVDKTFVYDGSGAQDDDVNYGPAVTSVSCPTPNVNLCAIIANDANNDGILSQAELDAFKASPRDPDHDGNFSEHGETAFILLKP